MIILIVIFQMVFGIFYAWYSLLSFDDVWSALSVMVGVLLFYRGFRNAMEI